MGGLVGWPRGEGEEEGEEEGGEVRQEGKREEGRDDKDQSRLKRIYLNIFYQ